MFTGVVNLLTFERLFSRVRRGERKTQGNGNEGEALNAFSDFCFLLSKFLLCLPIRRYPQFSGAIRSFRFFSPRFCSGLWRLANPQQTEPNRTN